MARAGFRGGDGSSPGFFPLSKAGTRPSPPRRREIGGRIDPATRNEASGRRMRAGIGGESGRLPSHYEPALRYFGVGPSDAWEYRRVSGYRQFAGLLVARPARGGAGSD